MFLRSSNSALRYCWRNLSRQYVSRTVSNFNIVHSNPPVPGHVSERIITHSRFFCSQQPEPAEADDETKRVTITFKKTTGPPVVRRAKIGETIQEVVVQDASLPGFGVCSGTLSCSTCHIILKPEDYDKAMEKLSDEELDLLGYAPENGDMSRLACCVKVTEEMDGMVLRVPDHTVDLRDEFNR